MIWSEVAMGRRERGLFEAGDYAADSLLDFCPQVGTGPLKKFARSLQTGNIIPQAVVPRRDHIVVEV
jgi:hypothetical protein